MEELENRELQFRYKVLCSQLGSRKMRYLDLVILASENRILCACFGPDNHCSPQKFIVIISQCENHPLTKLTHLISEKDISVKLFIFTQCSDR